jgi:hypothetical protein
MPSTIRAYFDRWSRWCCLRGFTVHPRIEEEPHDGAAGLSAARVYSPRLAHPEQAADFLMEVRKVPDAGL